MASRRAGSRRTRREEDQRPLTNINWGLALGLGMVLTALTYAIMYGLWLGLGFRQREVYAVAIFVDRGPVQHLIMLSFWTAIASLWLKHRLINRELWALKNLPLFPEILADVSSIEVEQADDILRHISVALKDHRHRAIVHRVSQAFRRVLATQSTAEVIPILNSLSDVDRSLVEASYAGQRFLAYAMPALGFIGTVLGVGAGIQQFKLIIPQAQNFMVIRGPLVEVARNLGVAFDTTLLGLVTSVITLLLMAFLQKREDDLLSRIDDYCLHNVANRVKFVGSETKAIIDALRAVREEVSGLAKAAPPAAAGAPEELRAVAAELRGQTRELVEAVRASVEHLLGTQARSAGDLTRQIEPVVQGLRQVLEGSDALSRSVDALLKAGDLAGALGGVGAQLAELRERLAAMADQHRDSVRALLLMLRELQDEGVTIAHERGEARRIREQHIREQGLQSYDTQAGDSASRRTGSG